MSLARNCQRRWFLQMTRQIVRLMCSYQQAIDAPNAIGGQILRGATFFITYCLGSASVAGTGWYGFAIHAHVSNFRKAYTCMYINRSTGYTKKKIVAPDSHVHSNCLSQLVMINECVVFWSHQNQNYIELSN